jgi:hypothetical protein
MNSFVEEAFEIYSDLRSTWFQSEIRQIVDRFERDNTDSRFFFLDRYIDLRLLTIYTVETFMQKVIAISVQIFSYYPRFGIVV